MIATTVPGQRVDVLIVDGDRLRSDLLGLCLGRRNELRVVEVVANRDDAVRAAREFDPDVVLVDSSAAQDDRPVEVGRAVRKSAPESRIVIFGDIASVPDSRDSVFSEGPGWSYVLRAAVRGVDDLVQIVLGAAAGMTIIDPAYIGAIESGAPPAPEFTLKQRGVLALVADGLSNDAIAAELSISVRTVEHHLNEVYQRLERCKQTSVNARVLAAMHFARTSPELVMQARRASAA